MELSEQVQCNLYYPDRGFQYNQVRLAGLEMEAWSALRASLPALHRAVPHLVTLLSSPFPIRLSRSELLHLVTESNQVELTDDLEGSALDAYLTIEMFLSQAQGQREAGVSLEIDLSVRHENQTLLLPGTDVLADLEEINRATGK